MSEEKYFEVMNKLKEMGEIIKSCKLSESTYKELEHAISKIRSNLAFEIMGISK